MARKRRRLHKRYGRKTRSESGGLRSNPPILKDMVEFIGPGFASFAATRFLTRIAAVYLARKKPSWGKHAGAITSIASFAGAYFGAHRVKMLAPYHTPIVVGSAIAALQSMIQLYIPKLGWMLADASPQISEELALPAQQQQQSRLPPGVELLDEDPNLYSYNDAFDNGRATGTASQPKPQAVAEDELLSDLNLGDDHGSLDLNLGSLGV